MAFQAGRDTDRLVPTPQPGGSRPIEGADILRHIARANVSYLMPVGHGVSVIAGLIKGTKSYEEFYAKYNVNYTRTYVTDNNPNFLFGAGASYPFTKSLEVGIYVVSEYQHLSLANNLPSYVAKLEWRASDHLTIFQNLYIRTRSEGRVPEILENIFRLDDRMAESGLARRPLLRCGYRSYGRDKK